MEDKKVVTEERAAYEAPELVEIGDAGELTLGWTNRTCADGCDCTKYLCGS